MEDPLTTQVISSHLEATAEEMAVVLVNAAFSSNITQRKDRSNAIFNASGEVIAEAHRTSSQFHLGSMASTMQMLLGRFPAESMNPGDMFIGNDPYNGGGQHLPDLNLIAPVFYEDQLIAYVASIGHHSDVGGMVAGSESGVCRTIFQEGLRLPLVRLVHQGELDLGIFDIIALNSRTPEDRMGDVRAQIAANGVGIRRVTELFDKYGIDTVSASMSELLDYGERRMRASISKIPNGDYFASDCLDSDGFGEGSPRIALKITVEDDRMVLDFAGTDPQMPSSRNSPISATKAVSLGVLRSIVDPGLPTNSGFYRAIELKAPPGCLLNPLPPAAVSERALAGGVLGDVIVRALSGAFPEHAMASSGPHQHFIPSGVDPRTGRFFVDYECTAGGYGARPYRDGMDAVRIHASAGSLLLTEPAEIDYPFLIERTELEQDSGGPGKLRGGMSIRRDYRMLADEISLAVCGERQVVKAAGLDGGLEGAAARFIRNPGRPTESQLPSTGADIQMQAGDVFRIDNAGGGGFGNPKDRDRDLVIRDLVEERISPRSASEHYGLDQATIEDVLARLEARKEG